MIEIPKYLSKFRSKFHLEWLFRGGRGHFEFQVTKFGLDRLVEHFHDGRDGHVMEKWKIG